MNSFRQSSGEAWYVGRRGRGLGICVSGSAGGAYNLGAFTLDLFTDVDGNRASTSNDDSFP